MTHAGGKGASASRRGPPPTGEGGLLVRSSPPHPRAGLKVLELDVGRLEALEHPQFPWGHWALRKPPQRQPAWGWGLHLADTGVLSEAGAEQGCPRVRAVGTERKVPGAPRPSHEAPRPMAHRRSWGTHLAPDPQNLGSPVAHTSNGSPATTPTWETSCKLQLQRPRGTRPQTLFHPVLLHPSARGSSNHERCAQATSMPSRDGPRPLLRLRQPGCAPWPPEGKAPPRPQSRQHRARRWRAALGGLRLVSERAREHGLWSPVNLKKGEAGPEEGQGVPTPQKASPHPSIFPSEQSSLFFPPRTTAKGGSLCV